jgi:transposase
MSMQPGLWPPVPEETARMVRAAFRKGSLAIRIRDELGVWCQDEDFADLFVSRGRPGVSPALLAVVSVLQFCENLTDRQAADAVRGRMDWKYCLGLELTDPGFDFSVLKEFRDRFTAGGAEQRLLDLLLTRCGELGLVRGGMRQRTDSTHVLARIRALNRLELAGESVRAALEELAAAHPRWLETVIDASWRTTYGRPVDGIRLPAAKAARAELAVQYARDGYCLLERLAAPGAPPGAAQLRQVQVLRTVLTQQFYRSGHGDGAEVIWREDEKNDGDGLPPGKTALLSPYDTDARYSEKRGTGWSGYKAHYGETASDPALDDPRTGRPQHPNLVTACATTHAAVADITMTGPVHDQLARRNLTPAEHAVDSGYASAAELIAARDRGITLITPVLAATSPQARSGGYTPDMFDIDWDARTVTCPQGKTTSSWNPVTTSTGRDLTMVRFSARDCKPCPARSQCTTARHNGRQLGLHPRQIHDELITARAAQATPEWKHKYASRAGVEGLMAQASHVTGIRRARYLGLPKTTLEHIIAACALNFIRLDAWWTSASTDRKRTSNLNRLNLIAAA